MATRQSIGMPWRHGEVGCDGCSASPILGYRYRSRRRSNYDLCSECFRQLTPHRAKGFDRIARCQESLPFQIYYISCDGCGQVPIQGPRYSHVIKPNYDLCETCFQQTASTRGNYQEPAALYREIEHPVTVMNSHLKVWSKPVYHFDRKCNECEAFPICGPCYVDRRDDALCALCYDRGIRSERFEASRYRMVRRPDRHSVAHISVLSCHVCGDLPIYGPAFLTFDGSRSLCLLCYLESEPQQQSMYTTRQEAPKCLEDDDEQDAAPDDEESDGIDFQALNLNESSGHGVARKKNKDSAAQNYTGRALPSEIEGMATDLTKIAAEGTLDPVVGRDKQIDQVIQILGRRTKSNACLIGEPGVGKTAVAEGLAQRIVQGQVPDSLKGKQIISVDMGQLLAGTKYRGEYEEKVVALLNASKEAGNLILFIDEIHSIVGSGKTDEGGMDAGDILKPALARGEVQCIGATTLEEYRKYIEKDSALERRFQKVLVLEPTVPEAIEILKGLKDRYETHHKVRYSDEALVAAAQLSHKYISDRFLPDKAIDLIDETGSRASSKGKHGLLITETDIQNLVAERTGIPLTQLSAAESDRLLQLEQVLHKRVIGQQEAVQAISSAVRRSRVGLQNPKRPIASFIFCGPTGVGKTELAKALAASYFGSEESMVRLDMSEFMEKNSISRLIGISVGYVGSEEAGQLTEAVRRRPHSLVLLDEVEKAHPDVFNLFLQILDDGRLSDSKGRVVDFKNTLLILTSNVGSSAILRQAGSGYSNMKSVVTQELEEHFRPEFLNRLDEIIVFQQLNKEQVGQIADLQLEQFAARLRDKNMELQISPRLRNHVLNEGFNPTYGARPLKRAITRLLENVMAERILAGDIKEGDSAVLDLDASGASPSGSFREGSMWRSLGKAAATESGTRRMEEKQTLYVFVQDEAGGAEKARSPVMHEAVWSRLPEDVLVQVLMRVPVLSHMRFRCVCRKWQAMLSDPSFVALCPPPQGMCSLGQKPGLGAGLNSFELPDSVLRVRTLSLSFLPLSSWILLASDKGLLLLGMEKGLLLQPLWQDVDDICLCVCNPVSKSWIQLPPLRTDMADEVLGTFLDVDAAAEAYRVVVVASNEQRQLIFVYRPGACVWDRMDWLNPLPGQHELVLCHGVIHGFWSDSRYASPRMKLLSFSLELGRPLGDTELARPDGAHLADTKLAVHEGCLLLVGSRTTTCQGFGIWKLDPIRMQWELVSTAPDELFLKGRKQCAKLVIKVGTVGEFISIEYDVARDHRTEKWVEELLAFHTGLKTWHAWHLPGLANPRRGLLDRKLVSFDPDWTRHCDPVKL